MICRRCLRLAQRATTPSLQATRTLTTTSSTKATVSTNTATQSAPRQGESSSSHNPPAATSVPGVVQPFSSPLSSSASNQDLPIAKHGKTSALPMVVKSSIVAGTVLKGLNFIKGKQDPVALEDKEYPSWLWGILNQHEGADTGSGINEGDLFSKSKKQRRTAAKALRKQQLLNPEALAPKVPLYEQSIDLPGGDGSFQGSVEAGDARGQLTKAMRSKRRSGIKEENFLKAMR